MKFTLKSDYALNIIAIDKPPKYELKDTSCSTEKSSLLQVYCVRHQLFQCNFGIFIANEAAEENLKKEAIAQGVDADRLVFSTRTAPASYLARYAIADLFLDTFPFNAGTTANDALWMGLPILTLTGRCFASRMAGALLTAANVPELIAYNIEDYEKKAVALATDTEACQRIRERLEDARNGGVLFDTPRFVSSFEQIMKNIYQQTSLPALD